MSLVDSFKVECTVTYCDHRIGLRRSKRFHAEQYKLLLYEPGGFFKVRHTVTIEVALYPCRVF